MAGWVYEPTNQELGQRIREQSRALAEVIETQAEIAKSQRTLMGLLAQLTKEVQELRNG